jgi:uncharacterized protein
MGDHETGWMEGSSTVFVGVLELEVLLGDVRSLKAKRGIVRPIVAELRKRFEVSAAEAGRLDLHRRSLIGVAVVAPDAAHCVEVMDSCERLVAARPEVELLSARQRLVGEDDEWASEGTMS